MNNEDSGKIWQEYITAAREGDLETVKSGIKDEDKISTIFPLILEIAAEHGHYEIVECLIANGADVNGKRDPSNPYTVENPPLVAAIHGVQVEITKLLIENGADVHAKTEHGLLLIHYAIKTYEGKNFHAELSVIDMLLAKGVDIESRDQLGRTSLHIAAREGRADLLPELVSRGATANTTDNHNQTSLEGACRSGSLDTVKFLVSHGAEINHSKGCAALGIVARQGFLDIVTFLLDNGAEPFSESRNGPELLRAAQGGNSEIVQLLISRGYGGSQGPESLLTASQNGTPKPVSLLLKHGVPIDVRNAKQQTVLHVAVLGARMRWYSHDLVIMDLLEKGADMNAVDADGKTPLDLAKELHCCNAIDIFDAFLRRIEDEKWARCVLQ